ncbi:MAG: hypothetical protein J0I29_02040, partial [Rhizobiales bacterium]|nr:hypothetical protein [Hyphomicrobiales bacterium]
MLARDDAVSAVSLAEKNADTSKQKRTMLKSNQCMKFLSTRFLCEFLSHKIAHRRRIDVICDDSLPDLFQKNKGQPA